MRERRDWAELLRSVRGAVPTQRASIPIPATPRWMSRTDTLLPSLSATPRLLSAGRVRWATIVQANQLLFRPGPDDSPASLLVGDDDGWDGYPDLLERLGSALFALKGKPAPEDAALARLGAGLADEMTREYGVEVPATFTDHKRAWLTTALIVRANLPRGVVGAHIVPVAVDDRYAFVIPSSLWPAALVAHHTPSQ